MKKIVFFTVIAFVSQMFCFNVLGQSSVEDQFDIANPNVTLRLASWWHWDNPVEYFAGMATVGKKGLGFGIDQQMAMYIGANRNVGIGEFLRLPSEKLTVDGNIKLTDNKKIIGTKELEISSDSLTFKVNGSGLQLKQGYEKGVTLYFPDANPTANLDWTRIIAADRLSITGGGRGQKDLNEIDLFIDKKGNIGIGTAFPSSKLTVAGSMLIEGRGNLVMKGGGYLQLVDDGQILVNTNIEDISLSNQGKFSMFVSKGILSEDYAIGPKSTWADHVFSRDYKLQNLNEVEKYIKKNNRLPDIPSAAEVQENGYTLHDMNVKLLQKVEELTLYSIEQNKEIEQLKRVVDSYDILLEKVNQLESRINQ
jgi:flagellar basal body rod protein FlgG